MSTLPSPPTPPTSLSCHPSHITLTSHFSHITLTPHPHSLPSHVTLTPYPSHISLTPHSSDITPHTAGEKGSEWCTWRSVQPPQTPWQPGLCLPWYQVPTEAEMHTHRRKLWHVQHSVRPLEEAIYEHHRHPFPKKTSLGSPSPLAHS